MMKMQKQHLAGVAGLILLGAGGRWLLQDVPNIETILVATVLAGALLGGRWAVVVALSSIALSDLLIGVPSIGLFTSSAWALIGAGMWLLRRRNKTSWAFPLQATGAGLAATLFFFVWTNFGVWLEGSLYAPTMAGLIESYVMALPFLRLHLLSTLAFVPAASVAVLLVARWRAARVTTPAPSASSL